MSRRERPFECLLVQREWQPDVLAEEIIENMEAGLASFREVLASLRRSV